MKEQTNFKIYVHSRRRFPLGCLRYIPSKKIASLLVSVERSRKWALLVGGYYCTPMTAVNRRTCNKNLSSNSRQGRLYYYH